MWKAYNIYTNKDKIIKAANRTTEGGFVNTDGAWCMTRNPEEFKSMLEYFFGFNVIECIKTKYSTAVATTECGLKIAWNGHCEINK